MIEKVGRASWLDKLCSEIILLSLIVEVRGACGQRHFTNCDQTLNEIESTTRTLCYNLHLQRLKLN